MHAQYPVFDQGSHRQHVESRGKLLPESNAVPLLALLVEPVDLRDVLALVIAAQKKHGLRVFNFVGEQQTNRLDGLLASIHVVS